MKLCPRILRDESGWRVTSWWDLSPDEEDNDIEDEVWIPAVVERGLFILGQDDAMRRSSVIRDTIINNEAHVFALTRADLTGRGRADGTAPSAMTSTVELPSQDTLTSHSGRVR